MFEEYMGYGPHKTGIMDCLEESKILLEQLKEIPISINGEPAKSANEISAEVYSELCRDARLPDDYWNRRITI